MVPVLPKQQKVNARVCEDNVRGSKSPPRLLRRKIMMPWEDAPNEGVVEAADKSTSGSTDVCRHFVLESSYTEI